MDDKHRISIRLLGKFDVLVDEQSVEKQLAKTKKRYKTPAVSGAQGRRIRAQLQALRGFVGGRAELQPRRRAEKRWSAGRA